MNMRVPAGLLLAILFAQCSGPGRDTSGGAAAADPSNVFRPTATIHDIMADMIDPSADAIWDSVSMYVDFEGLHESYPETEEEWAAVRRDALMIVEGSNLLLIPGREVDLPGSRAEFPEVELDPAEIQNRIASDPQLFVDLAHGLHEAALVTLRAIEAKDKDAVYASGEALDVACERCHITYWYPNDSRAREIFEENERMRREALEATAP